MDVVACYDPKNTIEKLGTGGKVFNKHHVLISVDPDHPKVKSGIKGQIKRTLAHELNHCAWKDIHGNNETLLDTLVMEGLVDHFDLQLHPDAEPYPWSVAVEGEDLGELRNRAKADFHNEDYNYHKWFFGVGDNDIPRWSGYAIGFAIVGGYLHDTDRQASEVIDLPSEAFTDE